MHNFRGALVALVCSFAPLLAQEPSGPRLRPLTPPAIGFIENRGQWDSAVLYHTALPGLDAWVTDDGIVYDFYRENRILDATDNAVVRAHRRTGQVVRMRFDGATGEAVADPGDRMPGVFSYFRGNDRSRWVSGARQFSELAVRHVYPGIDMRVHFDSGHMRYDLVVAPHADAARIQIRFEGADRLSVLPGGELAIATSIGEVVHRGLRAFQEVDGRLVDVTCAFVVSDDHSVGFAVGGYDRTRPLVIDPIVFSTFLGEKTYVYGGAVAADLQGHAYITGWTTLPGFPVTPGAYDTTFGWSGDPPRPPTDVIVTKFNAAGTALEYSTYLGGDSAESHSRIAVDKNGCAYIAGVTSSVDFPLVNPVDSVLTKGWPFLPDAFVTKLDSSGTSLVYSTFLGGRDGFESEPDIAVDDSAFAHVCGRTTSRDFPTTSGSLHPSWIGGVYDGFLCRLARDGKSFVFSTFIGGTGDDHCTSVGVDQIGRICIGGYTNSPGMFTTGAADSVVGGTSDGFVQRISPFGTVLMNGTLIGGSGYERDVRIAIDTTGVVYLAGNTGSTDLAVTANAFQTNFRRVFAARLSFDFSTFGYMTYFGGSRLDVVRSVALGRGGFLCVVGQVLSTDFFTKVDAVQRTLKGPNDAYMSIIRPSGGTLEYSTYLGGSNEDEANGAAFDLFGNVFLSGITLSSDFPTTPGAFDRTFDTTDASVLFLTKIGRCTLRLTAGADRSICVGDTVTIGGTATLGVPEYAYRWVTTDTTLQERGVPEIMVAPTTTTQYVLIASDIVGCSAIDTVTVVVNPLPIVEAGGDTTICDGGSARIGGATRSGTPPFRYAWAPTTGLDSATSASPLARPGITTTYSVFVIDAAGCSARDTVTVSVNQRPVIEKPSPFEICPGDTVSLGVTIVQGTPPYRYRWSPAAGLSSTSVASPRASPSVTTSYTVVVTDAVGCSTTADSIVVRVGGSLRTKIEVTGPMMLCAGDSVTLDAGSWARYRWSTGDTTRTIRLGRGGVFSVDVESASGCRGFSDTVIIGNGRTADPAIAGSLAGCAGSESIYDGLSTAPVAHLWRLAGNAGIIVGAGNQDTLRIRWLRDGVDTLQLITTSRDGCLDSSRIVIVVTRATPPVLAAVPLIRICEGTSTTLDAGSYSGYLWSTGETTRRIDIRTTGSYWVTITDAAGCTARSDTVRVEVAAKPAPSIVASATALCPGDSASLTAPPGYAQYRWSTGETSRSIVVRTAGRYSVTVTDSIGCTGTSTEEPITMYPAAAIPTISAVGDTLIASPAVAWQWYLNGVAVAGATARRYVNPQTGSYAVGIVDSNGCSAMSLAFTRDRRQIWIDTVSAELGQRVKLAVHISPTLRRTDGFRSVSLRLRVRPADLYAMGASFASPVQQPPPSVQNLRDGTILITGSTTEAFAGDTLVIVEVMGLSSAQPIAPVWVDTATIGTGDGGPGLLLQVAGNGLVRLSGCELGVFSAARRIRLSDVKAGVGSVRIEYRAPAAAFPELRLIDLSGRVVLTQQLPAGTDAEQSAELDTHGLSSGSYVLELRDREERVATLVRLML